MIFVIRVAFIMKKKMPNSLRKFIRLEKARIRRTFSDIKEQEKQIEELYKKLVKTEKKENENK